MHSIQLSARMVVPHDDSIAFMNFRALQLFQAVAELGSVTKAAEALHTVQSNVTMRIQTLEEELGVALFMRDKRQLKLTQAGLQFLNDAQQILALCDAAKQRLADDPNAGGILTVGCVETFSDIYIPHILAHYRAQYPKMMVNVRLGATETLLHELHTNQLDGAFTGIPMKKGLWHIEPLLQDELFIFSAQSVKCLKDLRDVTLITFSQACSIRHQTDAYWQYLGFSDYATMEFNSMATILECVKSNLGVTCLPGYVVRHLDHARCFQIHSVPHPFNPCEINLITPKTHGKVNMMNGLLSAAKQVIKSLH